MTTAVRRARLRTGGPGAPVARARALAVPALAVLAVAVTSVPLVYLGVRTAEAGLDRILAELWTVRVARLAGRTLLLVAVVTTAATALGTAAAFLTVRTDLPGRRLFGVLALLPLAVPTYVAAFAWVSTVDGFAGFWAAALVLTLACSPYVFLPVAAALSVADPALEEVSGSLGRSRWATLLRVTLPLVRPAITGGALLAALYVVSDFGAVAILRTDTFTRAVFVSLDLGFDRTGALVLSTVLVALALLIVLAETRANGSAARYARSRGDRRPPARIPLGRARIPAACGLGAAAVLALGVPAYSLTVRLLDGVSRPGTWQEVAGAAATSVRLAALGTLLTVLLSLPLAVRSVRAPGRLSTVLNRISYLSHALPGVVVGLSLVFLGVGVLPGLYQSVWMLALGYAALFLPLAVASVSGALAQAPPLLEEVGRSLGRPPLRVWWSVTLPLTLPGTGAGAALVFLTCMKELPATLLLRPTGMDTLTTQLWSKTYVGAYAGAAPYAALLVVLSALPAWVLITRTGILRKDGP